MPTLIEIARAYILRGEAYSALQEHFTGGGFKDYDDGQKCMDRIKAIPAADVVEVVRCRDCKHRIVNEHYGEKGYLKLKAMCELDTGDPFEFAKDAGNEDWFCADGERKDGGQDA